MCMKLITACHTHPACTFACSNPSFTFSEQICRIRASIMSWEAARGTDLSLGTYTGTPGAYNPDQEVWYTDRTFQRRPRFPSARRPPQRGRDQPKVCHVCNKLGCWSTNYTLKEQQDARERYRKSIETRFPNRPRQTKFGRQYRQYIVGDPDLDEAFFNLCRIARLDFTQGLFSQNSALMRMRRRRKPSSHHFVKH